MTTAEPLARLIGLSTYAFFWQWQSSNPQPLTLADMITRTAGWGVARLQICDYPAIETYHDDQLAALRRHAEEAGVQLELGTRGVEPDHLGRYLEIAAQLDVTLVRSMINSVRSRPSPAEARAMLGAVLPAYEAAGVTVALETYEQVPVRTLVGLVEDLGSPALGICLDPANSVAALEHPADTITRTAPHVRNVHVKDFAFTRADGWVGFHLTGCPMGEGLLPFADLLEQVRPVQRGISLIVEHWLPWQGDSATTTATEDQWTHHTLDHLRRIQPWTRTS